jgi:putative ABC transport system ATP-binding protein
MSSDGTPKDTHPQDHAIGTSETTRTAMTTSETTMTTTITVEVDNAVKEYAAGDRTVRAVDGISFELPAGAIAAIVGPSGSGKSTLLNLLGALGQPTSGEVSIDGTALSTLTARQLTELRLRHIGFVFQQFNLIPNLSALENVTLPMEFAHVDRNARDRRARLLLDAVGMGHRLDQRPGKLSGGEQQRVAIARALANDPPIILADEPTGNLDSRTGREVISLLDHLAAEQHKTLVFVTHDESVVEAADIVLHIQDGRLQ